jgi:hypothetical protein
MTNTDITTIPCDYCATHDNPNCTKGGDASLIHWTNLWGNVYCDGNPLAEYAGRKGTQDYDKVTCPDCDPTKPQG